MSNGGSPHNQTIRENVPKPPQIKETPPKQEQQASPPNAPAEKNQGRGVGGNHAALSRPAARGCEKHSNRSGWRAAIRRSQPFCLGWKCGRAKITCPTPVRMRYQKTPLAMVCVCCELTPSPVLGG